LQTFVVGSVTKCFRFVITGSPNWPLLYMLSSSVGVVCNAAVVRASRSPCVCGNKVWEHCRLSDQLAAGHVDGWRAGDEARGWSGGRHCTAGQYGYVPLG